MEEIRLTIQDNKKIIEVSVGASLTVCLEESPTTGYVWINKTVGDVLIYQDSDFTAALNGGIGGIGLRKYRFIVGKPGMTTLLLKQMRQWEGDSTAQDVYSVSIHAI